MLAHKIGILCALIFLQGILFIFLFEKKEGTLAFLDVGQGDAIYLQAKNGRDILIDAGSGPQIIPALQSVSSKKKTLDAILLTHPDKDHIGGFHFILDRFQVSHIFLSGKETDTETWKSLKEKINKEGARIFIIDKGDEITLGDISLTVLSPLTTELKTQDTNDASIVVKINTQTESVLLTGDASISIEEELVREYGESLKSDILKLGHHGSKTSSGKNFLEAVSPREAIISSGKNNTYGHPHESILSLLTSLSVPFRNTGSLGSIVFSLY